MIHNKNRIFIAARFGSIAFRMIITLFSPPLFGILFYSLLSGAWKVPLYYSSMLLALPILFLYAFPLLLIYSLIMEITGFTLLRRSGNLCYFRILYLITGAALSNLYHIIADGKSSTEWHIIITMTCLSVSMINLKLHVNEFQAE